jgi:hypothetical protein
MELLASKPSKEAGTMRKSQHALKKSSKRRRSSNVSTLSSSNDSKEDEVTLESRDVDVEYAISLCLRQLRLRVLVLSKHCDLLVCELLDGELSHDTLAVQAINDLCSAVIGHCRHEERLKAEGVRNGG